MNTGFPPLKTYELTIQSQSVLAIKNRLSARFCAYELKSNHV
ncbi:hypothetical protein D1AOALGA4SA_4698 [Olavius algarvensis Delta 1 endosymbiont]|nr:hypothetical protein D1AOALGA4SA_4698 [Olavius algarvensis Delta 1 endosymbiont]